MFGIGTTELLIIILVALVVLGPSKLPEIMKAMGKGIAEFKRLSTDVKSTLDAEVSRAERDERRKEKELAEKKARDEATKKAAQDEASLATAKPVDDAAPTRPEAGAAPAGGVQAGGITAQAAEPETKSDSLTDGKAGGKKA